MCVCWSFCFPPTILYLLSFVIPDRALKWPSAPGEWEYPSVSSTSQQVFQKSGWFLVILICFKAIVTGLKLC